MKTAIIIHGMPSKEEYFNSSSPAQSNKHWLPWVQRQLIVNGILAETPEMPEPYEPDYDKWRSVFERYPIDTDTILVGHSCGAGFLVRWLSEHKKKVGKVALVAPWLDPDHELKSEFFDFALDEDLGGRTAGLALFYAPDDDSDILQSVDLLKAKVKDMEIRELPGRGHFTMSDMKTDEFPELKDFLLKE